MWSFAYTASAPIAEVGSWDGIAWRGAELFCPSSGLLICSGFLSEDLDGTLYHIRFLYPGKERPFDNGFRDFKWSRDTYPCRCVLGRCGVCVC